SGPLIREPFEEALCHGLLAFEHVPLHLPLVREDFERFHEAWPAPVTHHAFEFSDHFIDFGRADRTLFDRDQPTRVHFPVADAPVLKVELGPVAVSKRLPAFDRDSRRIKLDLPHPPQRLCKDVPLVTQLRIVSCMLVLATAATPEDRTGSGNAIGGGNL